MLRKTLLTLSVSAMLGTAVVVPNAALAFGPPPMLGGPPPGLGGPPPGLGLGGLPAGPRLGGPAGHPGAGGLAGFRGGAGRGFHRGARGVLGALRPTPMATLHAMAAAIVDGEITIGEAMAALSTAIRLCVGR